VKLRKIKMTEETKTCLLYIGNLPDDYYELITADMTDFAHKENIGTYRIVRGSEDPPDEVYIPAQYKGLPVTEIGRVNVDGTPVFYRRNNIKTLHIPENITFIDEAAFFGCTCLKNINVDNNNTNFTSKDGILYNKTKTELVAFPAANGIVTIPTSVISIGKLAFCGCANITDIIIHENVTYISESAFRCCTNLENIDIPGSIMHIGYWAFAGCTNLKNITVDTSNPNFTSKSGILYNKTKTKLIAFPAANGVITILESVTSIGEGAFAYCKNLINITIPEGITCIGEGSFHCCTGLKSITIPKSVVSLGKGAFTFWTDEQTINIPGHANKAEADAVWGIFWKGLCSAVINYSRIQ
jgi:ribulose 1,5-bisphosphate synthetase/thiazole synthase